METVAVVQRKNIVKKVFAVLDHTRLPQAADPGAGGFPRIPRVPGAEGGYGDRS